MISQRITEIEKVLPVVMMAGDQDEVLHAIERAVGRLRERAVLLNAEGWQSRSIDSPVAFSNPRDGSVEVQVFMTLTKEVENDE